MRRLPRRASVLMLWVGCASADRAGPADIPVETVELAAVDGAAPSASAENDAPRPSVHASASARIAVSPEASAPSDPSNPAVPAFGAPVPLVPASTTAPASQSEISKLEPALDAAVMRDAPGMTLDAGTAAGRFAQGAVLEQTLILLPGRCYTIVAQSRGPIAELDVTMVTSVGPSMPPMALAVDADQGPQATLGRAPGCFRNPLPLALPVLLRVTAKSGSGVAAVRVLSK